MSYPMLYGNFRRIRGIIMEYLLSIGVAMLAGLMLTRLTKKFNLPDVTSYLIAGLLVGPLCLGALGIPHLGLPSYEFVDKLGLISDISLGFIAFSILNGMTMSVFFAVYTTASIALTFFVSAGMFGAMALIGYTTKKDLSSIGGFLIMALIGLIIAGLVNMFLRSTMFDLIISGLGVILFCGLTAWDMQWIKRALLEAPDMGEASQKIALLGALNLYLDFINLFLYLLRFLGDRRN